MCVLQQRGLSRPLRLQRNHFQSCRLLKRPTAQQVRPPFLLLSRPLHGSIKWYSWIRPISNEEEWCSSICLKNSSGNSIQMVSAHGFKRPVPNGRGSSGFWLVPENLCFFSAQSQNSKARSHLVSSYTKHTYRPVARHICLGHSPRVYSKRKVPITAQNVGVIFRHIRKKLARNMLDFSQVS